MTLDDIRMLVEKVPNFSCAIDGDVLRIENIDTQSQFISEIGGDIIQIRQAVKFDCDTISENELIRLLKLCSSVNERFTLTKSFIDHWGVLITSCELHTANLRESEFSLYLDQVEFISLSVLSLLKIMETEGREILEGDIDAILSART